MRYFMECLPMRLLALLSLTLGYASLALPVSAAETTQAIVLGDPSLTAGIPGEGTLTMEEIQKWLSDAKNHEELEFELPEGLAAGQANIFIPADNPLTRAKIELGRQLYFDPWLSDDFTVSCATCHDPDQGYTAQTQFGVGIQGLEGGRNSPVAYNRILSREQFWDGRAATLEEQAVGPIANPIEMGSTHDACVECLEGIPGYKVQFEKIFEDGVTIDNVGRALASFERVLVTGPTPFDAYQPLQRFEEAFADDLDDLEELREEDPEFYAEYMALKEAADARPMTESARRGMVLFFDKANCAACHAGANFTDEDYHNLGVGMEADEPDLGRYEVTKLEEHKGAFKTPTLRNVHLTAPYMHDGSQATLEEVMDWYNKGGHPNEWLSDKMKPLELSDQELADVVEFMKQGLAGSFPKVEPGRMPE
jgi:cytochrome c peroxidase